jgi:glucosamine 6-phosphate synthetase-like amidotransferase/phosphosugar isomerase protein
MCGIVGYVGNKQVVPLIIDGLRKLEYRGYDSAGIAVVDEANHLEMRRAEGKLRNLEECIRFESARRKLRHSGIRAGRRTGDRPKKTHTRTVTNRAKSSWCITELSKIICSSKSGSLPKAVNLRLKPIRKSSRI